MMAVVLMLFSLIGLVLTAPFSFSFMPGQFMTDEQYFELMRTIQPESPYVNRKPALEVPEAVPTQKKITGKKA